MLPASESNEPISTPCSVGSSGMVATLRDVISDGYGTVAESVEMRLDCVARFLQLLTGPPDRAVAGVPVLEMIETGILMHGAVVNTGQLAKPLPQRSINLHQLLFVH